MAANTPLHNKGIDAVQSLKKTYDPCKEAHRVDSVNVDYNIAEYTYTDSGQISTISYYYEATAEVTKLILLDDCAGSYNGKIAGLNVVDDAKRYRLVFSVDCGTTKPLDDPLNEHILINIQSCDTGAVIAGATKIYLDANTNFSTSFCVSICSNVLTITNAEKGLVTNATGTNGVFTLDTITEGTKVLKEKLIYTYDSEGNVSKVVNNSGENLLNFVDAGPQKVLISSGGATAKVSSNNELRTEISPAQENIFNDILLQLRILNVHMSLITNEDVGIEDLEEF